MQSNDKNPLKDVPERQIAYWKQKGYSKADMEAEAELRQVSNLREYRKLHKAKKAK